MENNKEKSVIQCKICGEFKERFLVGKFGNTILKKWADVNGKLFNGRICPECHVKKTKENMRNLRAVKHEV